jgi:MinD-like ATPase involved in chromosome partitioning or flagellar assembly
MAELNIFGKDKRLPNGSGSGNKNFNVIIADTRWETFETLSDIKENYNFLNLSSEFAVNFILDYEKIDLIIVGIKIGGLEAIAKKAERKKTKVYVMGKDLSYPVDREEVLSIIKKEYDEKITLKKSGSGRYLMDSFEKIFRSRPGVNAASDNSADCMTANIRLANKKHALTKSANKKTPDICGTNNEDTNIEGTNTAAAKFWDINTGAANTEYAGIGPANIKDININPDKEQNKTSQFYNDFWKEVAIEAKDGFLDNAENEEVRKPNQNMHEYGKKNESSYKQRLADTTGGESESLMPAPGKVITIKQKIMVFVKAKGGVGSTFLSLYLAYEFRKLKTLLIDLNFSEGGSDIGYYLGMPKSPNMVIFTEGYNRISMDNSVINFKGYFDILQPPPSYDLTKKLDMQDIYSIVDIARRKYHLLIFDLPNQINDIFFGVLDMADLAIMVSDYTPGSIGRLASINKRFIYNDMEKILVLNKNKNNSSHSFIKNNISEFISLKEIVNIDENSLLSGKSDFKECDFSNNKDMLGFKNKVMESLTCD